jgi:hypothetical protein
VLSYLSKYKILIKNKMAGVCHAIGNELTLFILFEWCVQRIMMVDHSLPRHFLSPSTSSFLCNIVYVTMAEGWLGSDEFFFFFFHFILLIKVLRCLIIYLLCQFDTCSFNYYLFYFYFFFIDFFLSFGLI